jgi:hypothetical protein
MMMVLKPKEREYTIDFLSKTGIIEAAVYATSSCQGE